MRNERRTAIKSDGSSFFFGKYSRGCYVLGAVEEARTK